MRKVGLDGWKAKNILGVELQKGSLLVSSLYTTRILQLTFTPQTRNCDTGFVDLGYKLFLDTPSSCPVSFLVGDIFAPSFYSVSLEPAPSASSGPTTLSSLTSLSPLHNKIRALHAGSLFHLFDEATQKKLAEITLSLMDQSGKGSVIFGSHVGNAVKGFRSNQSIEGKDSEGKSEKMFCHDPT